MKSVGAQASILKASEALQSCLTGAGTQEQFSTGSALFREDDSNAGVYLVLKGRVCLSVRNLPKLDRVFTRGSVLGLPSTFTARPYSLTAIAITDSDIVHVGQEDFLRLMRDRTDLCGEATTMLGREVSFIQSALAQRRKQIAAKKISGMETVPIM